MRLNNPDILITREVDESLLQQIISKGINVDVLPFIQTEIIRKKRTQQQIENVLRLNTTVVFTSRNSVEAVAEYLKNIKPFWKIYCIGNTTRILVENYLGSELIAAVANNAKGLAEKIIIDKSTSEVYFFCGDKKRKELPELLKQNNISVNEIEVYRTTILKHRIEKNYDGILFFSPSAVNGFFQNNKINDEAILFAIGNTTSEKIKKFCRNKIVIGDEADKKNLVEKTIEYFTQ